METRLAETPFSPSISSPLPFFSHDHTPLPIPPACLGFLIKTHAFFRRTYRLGASLPRPGSLPLSPCLSRRRRLGTHQLFPCAVVVAIARSCARGQRRSGDVQAPAKQGHQEARQEQAAQGEPCPPPPPINRNVVWGSCAVRLVRVISFVFSWFAPMALPG